MGSYEEFVASKLASVPPTGIAGAECDDARLFPHQRDLVRWALRRGRAAVFADTGLGKSRIQLAWAQRVHEHTGKPALILAPLAVAEQTAAEGAAIGVAVNVATGSQDVAPGVNITNYEKLHRFDSPVFGAVALDESSIIKNYNSKTLAQLLDAFARTPFRLACTATPSPNDYTELGTHCELLGVCSRAEMLSEFFVHDGGDTQSWRIKGHARVAFWRFVASWGALVRSPADLGYDASAYVLPGLSVRHHVIATSDEDVRASGLLFAQEAASLMDRRSARKSSVGARVAQCADLVNASREPWVVWCDLNAESDALARAIVGAVEVTGSMTPEEKAAGVMGFVRGERRVLVSKPSLCGFGVNMQHCANVAFVGVTDSWEAYYQAVRRCYRFGQKREVAVHIFASEAEGAVVANLQRKERAAAAMAEELSRETSEMVRSEVRGAERESNEYAARPRVQPPSWMSSEGE